MKNTSGLFTECRKWRAKPIKPKMADLQPTISSLFISAPILVRRPFWFDLKSDHKTHKTQPKCIHIEILTSLNMRFEVRSIKTALHVTLAKSDLVSA